ncbi:PilW family protein [Paraferrimonas sp. SM1919]|uniref:PilW family protein n=1 Tax=Paraferrimonas sp. SM1919 TaxID=2662263 RepID=UPI0013D24322|nr:PilW family protein [Paraferrimonas sp. SM1919]
MTKHAGFSLVELLIASTIGLVLTTGLYQLLSISQQNSADSSHHAQIQESANDALNMLIKDIAQVGFMADLSQLSLLLGDNVEVQTNADPDCVGGGENNATFPSSSNTHFRTLWAMVWSSSSRLDCAGLSPKVGSEVIQIKRLQGPDTSIANLQANQFYFVSNINKGIFFNSSETIPTLLGGKYWRYLHRFYYIETESRDGVSLPVLKVRELGSVGMVEASYVDGIEQIAFSFGIDSNNDGNVDGYLATSGMSSLQWDSQRILAVTIYVVARALEKDEALKFNKSFKVSELPVTGYSDGYRRFLASTTIKIENPILRGDL